MFVNPTTAYGAFAAERGLPARLLRPQKIEDDEEDVDDGAVEVEDDVGDGRTKEAINININVQVCFVVFLVRECVHPLFLFF